MRKIVCNPMNLDYRYQFKSGPLGNAVFREAADPTMVVYGQKYLLFASMSAGFWYSEDLYDWKYKPTPELPIYDYAPDVRVVNGGIMFCASRRNEKCSIFFSKDPLREPFRLVSMPLTFWDPDIFQDDDGRVYLYWGCSTREPIYGIELDAETMQPIGKKAALADGMDLEHGWERMGENNILKKPKTKGEKMMRFALGTKPCMEGAFMTKHDGLYYLQYAAPGTEFNVYGDGVYVGASPLGPFRYQTSSPFSSRPGGFITGAGHGSTFQDLQGKWWHVSTMRISVNDNYERRIGLFPCDFDENGILHCNQNFADYPYDLENPDLMTADPEWMLLSLHADVTASSFEKGYEPANATDENIRTWWAAAEPSEDEWLQMDLGEKKEVRAIQVNFADHKLPLLPLRKTEMRKENIGYRKIVEQKQQTIYLLEGSSDGINWQILMDRRTGESDLPHDFTFFEKGVRIRYLKLSGMQAPMGGRPAVSGLRVFGRHLPGEITSGGPSAVQKIHVRKKETMNVRLTWPAAKGADGYNVRYGIQPDKLYASWQVYGKNELELSTLNAGVTYYAAVDAFNEYGITHGNVFCILQGSSEIPSEKGGKSGSGQKNQALQ